MDGRHRASGQAASVQATEGETASLIETPERAVPHLMAHRLWNVATTHETPPSPSMGQWRVFRSVGMPFADPSDRRREGPHAGCRGCMFRLPTRGSRRGHAPRRTSRLKALKGPLGAAFDCLACGAN